jgi:uncharacterized membrane protein
MNMKLHIVNTVYAIIIITTGLAGYLLNESRPPTALITPLVGLLLLGCTRPLKRKNRFVINTVAVITLLLSLMTARLFTASIFATPDLVENLGRDVVVRRAVVFGIMAFSGFVATGFYAVDYIRRRRERQIVEKQR